MSTVPSFVGQRRESSVLIALRHAIGGVRRAPELPQRLDGTEAARVLFVGVGAELQQQFDHGRVASDSQLERDGLNRGLQRIWLIWPREPARNKIRNPSHYRPLLPNPTSHATPCDP